MVQFDNDVNSNIKAGDENYLSLLVRADAYIKQNRLDLPEDPISELSKL
jgi:putative flavoprotein involved in K+ transport